MILQEKQYYFGKIIKGKNIFQTIQKKYLTLHSHFYKYFSHF